ncbi:VanZ like family protein [Colletotrichum cuscutae]|uniref:VanZ like family protein n=1 Tax=Colletotrichum cuscutae TaxID=1209917 RepID=A0AAI9XNI0_9PEZI|nr:VanZ like family protein [Colletotrichum cuscutae]
MTPANQSQSATSHEAHPRHQSTPAGRASNTTQRRFENVRKSLATLRNTTRHVNSLPLHIIPCTSQFPPPTPSDLIRIRGRASRLAPPDIHIATVPNCGPRHLPPGPPEPDQTGPPPSALKSSGAYPCPRRKVPYLTEYVKSLDHGQPWFWIFIDSLQSRVDNVAPSLSSISQLHLSAPSLSSISQLQLQPKPQPKLKLNFISIRAQTSAQARKRKYAEPKLTLPSSPSGVFFALLLVAGYAGLTTLQLGQYVNDKVLHFTTFFLLTIVFYWILDTNRRRTLNLTLTVCTFILGVGSEFLQGFLPNGREFDFYDIVANVVGSLAGIGLCSWYHKRMLERKRRTKTYQAVPGEDEEDVELGEGHETGVVEASGARDGGAGVGAGASSGGRSLEEEVDNWDENQVDDWEEEDGDGDIGGVKSKDMDTGDIGDSKKRAD